MAEPTQERAPDVTWAFWRWRGEIRRLRRVNRNLMRKATDMHIRAGIAEGWLTDGSDTALIDMARGSAVEDDGATSESGSHPHDLSDGCTPSCPPLPWLFT